MVEFVTDKVKELANKTLNSNGIEEKAKKPRKPRATKIKEEKPEVFKCEFCKAEFTRESVLLVHMCEKKRRWLWRDEKYIRIGFMAYQKFYELCMYSKKEKTYKDFMNSKQFNSFAKFGKYLVDINAVKPEKFVEFVIKANIKVNDWTADWVYETWVRELAKKEQPDEAVKRNILLMEQWARETGDEWYNFFRNISTTLATQWIRTGRISPWVLYTSVGGQLIDRMTDEQLNMIKDFINPTFWKQKIAQYKDDLKYYDKILKEAGL